MGKNDSITSTDDIPAFGLTKKPRKEPNSVANVINGAAIAFAKALTSGPEFASITAQENSISPGKTVELRRKSCNMCSNSSRMTF